MKPISASRPSFIEPMQALLVATLPDGDWLYEVKLDGYRALAFKDSRDVRLISRNNKPLSYPPLLDSLKLLAVEQVILDGEIVALDEKGRSSFQLLQVYKSSQQCVPLVYYVFDLLFVDGKDLRKEPLLARRKLLADILKKAPPDIRLSEGFSLLATNPSRPDSCATLWGQNQTDQGLKSLLRFLALELHDSPPY